METSKWIKSRLLILALLCSISLIHAQNKPSLDYTVRGGAGIVTPTNNLLSPIVANASMEVSGWLNNHWKVGGELSYTQMELKSTQPLIPHKERLLNQLFIGPSIALSSLRDSRSGWSAQGSLAIGYTLLFRDKTKDSATLLGDYDAFNSLQHGFGLNISVDVRKSIEHCYVGLGYVYSSRMIQVGPKDHHTTTFVSMGMPQLVFGMAW